jgi:hypothetical protein
MLKLAYMETPHDKKMDDMALHESKAEIFDTWATINRAFEQIISALDKLQTLAILSDDYVQDQDTLANDMWARINSQILVRVNEREADDRNHYGKMRATIERRIRGKQ